MRAASGDRLFHLVSSRAHDRSRWGRARPLRADALADARPACRGTGKSLLASEESLRFAVGEALALAPVGRGRSAGGRRVSHADPDPVGYGAAACLHQHAVPGRSTEAPCGRQGVRTATGSVVFWLGASRAACALTNSVRCVPARPLGFHDVWARDQCHERNLGLGLGPLEAYAGQSLGAMGQTTFGLAFHIPNEPANAITFAV